MHTQPNARFACLSFCLLCFSLFLRREPIILRLPLRLGPGVGALIEPLDELRVTLLQQTVLVCRRRSYL